MMPLKLAILGATGPTGLQLVEQALSRGHEVVAIVRTPERLGQLRDRPGLTVRQQADACADPDGSLSESLSGCQAVLCSLGTTPSMFRIDLLTRAVPLVVAAMRKAAVKRLVLLTAQCTVYHPDHPKLLEWLFKPLVIGRNLDDFWRAECYLAEQCTDINYTVVKPPELANKPLDPRPLLTQEGQMVTRSTSVFVPRANVAKFMLDCAESDELWRQKMVAIQF